MVVRIHGTDLAAFGCGSIVMGVLAVARRLAADAAGESTVRPRGSWKSPTRSSRATWSTSSTSGRRMPKRRRRCSSRCRTGRGRIVAHRTLKKRSIIVRSSGFAYVLFGKSWSFSALYIFLVPKKRLRVRSRRALCPCRSTAAPTKRRSPKSIREIKTFRAGPGNGHGRDLIRQAEDQCADPVHNGRSQIQSDEPVKMRRDDPG